MKFNSYLVKRVLCGALSAFLILGTVGCAGSGGTSSDGAVDGGKHDIVGKDSDDLSFEALGLPELEITGDKVTYLNWMDAKSELEDPKQEAYQINLLLKKYYNCEIEFITTTYEELPVKAAQMVLSGESPDIIFYKSADNPNFINNNIAQPVDDYVDLSNKWFDNIKLEDYTVDGKHYFIGRVTNNGRVYYWKDMFTDIGEKTPLELYYEGEWTWSKFKELAKKLTVDSNGDGTPEIYGCNVDPLYMYTSCGADFVKFNADGTVSNNMKSPLISKAMNFLQDIGKSGSNANGGEFTDGTAAMLWNERWMDDTFSEYFKKGTVEYAPAPMMDGAEEYYVPGRIETDWLAAGAPNPGGAIAWFVCAALLEDHEYYSDRIAEIENELVGYTDEMIKLNEELESDKFVRIPTRMEGIGNWETSGMWNMLDEISKWGTPWTSCLETYYSAFQAEIDRANQTN